MQTVLCIDSGLRGPRFCPPPAVERGWDKHMLNCLFVIWLTVSLHKVIALQKSKLTAKLKQKKYQKLSMKLIVHTYISKNSLHILLSLLLYRAANAHVSISRPTRQTISNYEFEVRKSFITNRVAVKLRYLKSSLLNPLPHSDADRPSDFKEFFSLKNSETC